MKIHPWIPGHCKKSPLGASVPLLQYSLHFTSWLLWVLLLLYQNWDTTRDLVLWNWKGFTIKKNVLFTCTCIHAFSFLICRRGYSCWARGETDTTYTHRISELFLKQLPFSSCSQMQPLMKQKYVFKPEKYYFQMFRIVSRARQILTYIFLLNM